MRDFGFFIIMNRIAAIQSCVCFFLSFWIDVGRECVFIHDYNADIRARTC